ncbi:MAG: hypothetical protein WAL66_18835 [Nitrososphaeraceae archaeon]
MSCQTLPGVRGYRRADTDTTKKGITIGLFPADSLSVNGVFAHRIKVNNF